jgi:hypothetical protein
VRVRDTLHIEELAASDAALAGLRAGTRYVVGDATGALTAEDGELAPFPGGVLA